ncbi:tRNA (uracil(54)-C(5))-methyltransferase -B [Chamberlinius hualienensis]
MAGSMRLCENVLNVYKKLCVSHRQLIHIRGIRGGIRRVVPLNEYFADEDVKKPVWKEDYNNNHDEESFNYKTEKRFKSEKFSKPEKQFKTEKYGKAEKQFKTERYSISKKLSESENDWKTEKPLRKERWIKDDQLQAERSTQRPNRAAENKKILEAKLASIFQPASQPILDECVTVENQYRKLAESMTPLWEVPYESQLNMKYKKHDLVLRSFVYRMIGNHVSIFKRPNGLPCYLDNVRPSPIQEQYRNKDEFNVQIGVDGNPKTVGFYVGSWDKQMVIVPGNEIVISKKSHKKVALAFQEYIRASSHPTCLHFKDGGVWRLLRVRSNDAGDLMAIVIVYPGNLTEAALLEEQEKLKEYFTNGPGKSCNLKSLYFQTSLHTRSTNEQSPYRLLFGESHLNETLNGLTFQISPESFFQCNKQAAEVLYDTIQDVAIKDPSVSILDLYCGTGTIGLTMANNVKQVIGIEAVNQAVLDAQHNAKINGIDNAKFYAGDAKTLIDDACKSLAAEDVVVVVNPTRGGLSQNVIDAFRKSKSIHQLIYVSCQPEGLSLRDFERLCMPSWGGQGKPYTLRRAVPVDLFPHTYHCEFVLVFNHML